jgi:NADH dehydrogenase FAD-containing subunit
VWTAGVAPASLISALGLGVEHGRLIVDDALQARDHPDVFALGDAAAVPDLTRMGRLAAQTAQQAQRQGVTAARNVVASLEDGEARAYRHRDLGFSVDLTGRNAIATPPPVGERLVFRVSLVHRVIECFVLGIVGGVAIFSESPEKEAVRSFGN